MKIHGNTGFGLNELQEFLVEYAAGPAFPTAKIGRMVFRTDLKNLFLCVQTAPTPLWLPLYSASQYWTTEVTVPDAQWDVYHGLDSEDLFIQVYDSSGYQIIPEEIIIMDNNNARIVFSTAYTGKAIFAVMNENESIAQQISAITDHSPKYVSIKDPQIGDYVTLFKTDVELTVSQVSAVLVKTIAPGLSEFTIKFGLSRATGTELVVGGWGTTNETIGDVWDGGTFDNQVIPANSWIWVEVTNLSGTVFELAITIDI